MPRKIRKNPKGGKKHKQKASKDYKNTFNGNITYCDEKLGQYYALVTQRLGGNRLLVKTLLDKDLKEVQAVIPGRFRNKVYMNANDVILIQRRDFNNEQFDIIYKYNDNESKILEKEGKLNFSNQNEINDDNDNLIDFTDKNDIIEQDVMEENTFKNEHSEQLDVSWDDI